LKRLLERIDREILASGGKRSRSRAIVIEGFFRARDHVTIEDLTRSVRESAPGIGAVTVYRTLKLLERLGYAKELDFGEEHGGTKATCPRITIISSAGSAERSSSSRTGRSRTSRIS